MLPQAWPTPTGNFYTLAKLSFLMLANLSAELKCSNGDITSPIVFHTPSAFERVWRPRGEGTKRPHTPAHLAGVRVRVANAQQRESLRDAPKLMAV